MYAQLREILATKLERFDLKVAAQCIRTGGAFIANAPKSDEAVMAAIDRAYWLGHDHGYKDSYGNL